MAKEKKSNASSKSLIMVIVTGVILATATLCWFATNGGSKVDQVESPILGGSSAAVFYRAEDVNKNGQIDEGEEYLPIESTVIQLADMVPGGRYFYMVQFDNCPNKSAFTLNFEGVDDKNIDKNGNEDQYGKYITVNASLKKVESNSTETDIRTEASALLSNKYVTDESGTVNAQILHQIGDTIESGKYKIYYDFYLDENVEIDKMEYRISISNVNALVEVK